MRILGLSGSGPAGVKRGSLASPAGWAVFALTSAGIATLDNDRSTFHSESGLSPQAAALSASACRLVLAPPKRSSPRASDNAGLFSQPSTERFHR